MNKKTFTLLKSKGNFSQYWIFCQFEEEDGIQET